MNIVLVVNNVSAMSSADTTLQNRLQTTLGHTVAIVNDHDAAPDLSTTQAVVISPSANNNQIATKYDNAPCGVFAMGIEPHSAFSGGTFAGNGTQISEFDVLVPGDPLLAGLSGSPLTLLAGTPAENYTYFDPASLTSDIVQVLRLGPDRVVLARAPQGAIVSGGVRLPTRRVFYTPNEDWPQLLNATGWAIFDSAVAYVGAAPGQFPTANANANQEVEANDVVQLSSAGSTDPDGSITTYAWRVISNTGPAITLSNAATANPTFVAPAVACRIVLGLTVTDNHADALKSLEDTVRVDVVSHLMTHIALDGVWVEKPLHSAKGGLWY